MILDKLGTGIQKIVSPSSFQHGTELNRWPYVSRGPIGPYGPAASRGLVTTQRSTLTSLASAMRWTYESSSSDWNKHLPNVKFHFGCSKKVFSLLYCLRKIPSRVATTNGCCCYRCNIISPTDTSGTDVSPFHSKRHFPHWLSPHLIKNAKLN